MPLTWTLMYVLISSCNGAKGEGDRISQPRNWQHFSYRSRQKLWRHLWFLHLPMLYTPLTSKSCLLYLQNILQFWPLSPSKHTSVLTTLIFKTYASTDHFHHPNPNHPGPGCDHLLSGLSWWPPSWSRFLSICLPMGYSSQSDLVKTRLIVLIISLASPRASCHPLRKGSSPCGL